MGTFGRAVLIYVRECYYAKEKAEGWGSKVIAATNLLVSFAGATAALTSVVAGWSVGPATISVATVAIVLLIGGLRMAYKRVEIEDQAAHDFFLETVTTEYALRPEAHGHIRIVLRFKNRSHRRMNYRMLYGGVRWDDDLALFGNETKTLLAIDPESIIEYIPDNKYHPKRCTKGELWFNVEYDTDPPTKARTRKYCFGFTAYQEGAFLPYFQTSVMPWENRNLAAVSVISPLP